LRRKTMYICFMDMQNKTVNINLRVTEEIKKELERMAASDRRTLSDFIRLQLEKVIENLKQKTP
jgi:uncharacterized protein (DUF1778 family)